MVQNNNGYTNGSGNGSDPEKPNVIDLSRAKERLHSNLKAQASAAHPPLLNIPPVTKFLLFALVGIHIALWGLGFVSPEWQNLIYMYGSFVPGAWSGIAPFDAATPFTVIAYSFLHGSWLHIFMNGAMLLAFGSGAEKNLGARFMLIVYFGSVVFAALAHFLLDQSSVNPMIGASGGISGLFGAMMYVMRLNAHNSGQVPPRFWPMVAIWVGISFVMGMMGGPDGSKIAWAAHIGGFLSGIVISAALLKRR